MPFCYRSYHALEANLSMEDYEVIHYKGKTIHGTKELKQHYTLEVPKRADLTKECGIAGDPYFVEYRLTYSDASVIYVHIK